MPRITVDFSDVQDFEVLPKGRYAGIITRNTLRNVDVEDKSPYMNVEIEVSEVISSKEDPGDCKGRKLWMVMSTSPKALGITKQYLENLDLFSEEFEIDAEEDDNGDLVVITPELVGLPVEVEVSKRKYEGREQNQVDGIWAVGNSGTGKKKTPAKKAGAAGPGRRAHR